MSSENDPRNDPMLPRQDAEHLRLLSIFHYVMAGLVLLFSLFWIIYPVLGYMMIQHPEMMETEGDVSPEMGGWIFIIVGVVIIIVGLIMTAMIFSAARFLAQRRHYIFCLVVAALLCLFTPLGTILGVFTIIVLSRMSVKDTFAARRHAPR